MALRLDGLKVAIATAIGLAPAACSRPLVEEDDGADDGGSAPESTQGSSDDTGESDATAPSSTTTDGSSSSAADTEAVRTCVSDAPAEVDFCYGEPINGECDCYEQPDCPEYALSIWTQDNQDAAGCAWFSGARCTEIVGDQCCYTGLVSVQCGKGRPLMAEGEAVTAPLCARDDWARSVVVAQQPVDEDERRTVARHWLQAGLDEHASVASFARFMLDLTAMGAPPRLLSEAAAAMRDEVRHAELAFGLARRFGIPGKGPGPLDVGGPQERDPKSIVLAAVLEGCVAETMAAAEAEVASQRARDPIVVSALKEIAADEARHAALAWRFVQWALGEHPELRPAVEAAFSEVAQHEPQLRESAPRGLESFGVLEPETIAAAHRQALEETIVPCAKALSTMSSMDRLRGIA